MSSSSSSSRHRGWCFTINNPGVADKTWVERFSCTYMVCGEETGESGTPHLQGYLHLENAKSLSGMKLIHPRAHWEPARGTPQEASDYCKKDGQFTERGTLPQQGKRTDLDEVKRRVKARHSLAEIVFEATSYQSMKAAELLYSHLPASVRHDMCVTWFFGPSGSGKSYRGDFCAGRSAFVKPAGRWFNGYDNQDTIFWDEFRDNDILPHDLFRLLEPRPFAVEIKGGYRHIAANSFVFTSIQPPWEFYQPKEDPFQLVRRIDFIVYMGADDGAFIVIEQKFRSAFPQLFSPPVPGRPHFKTQLLQGKKLWQ